MAFMMHVGIWDRLVLWTTLMVITLNDHSAQSGRLNRHTRFKMYIVRYSSHQSSQGFMVHFVPWR